MYVDTADTIASAYFEMGPVSHVGNRHESELRVKGQLDVEAHTKVQFNVIARDSAYGRTKQVERSVINGILFHYHYL